MVFDRGLDVATVELRPKIDCVRRKGSDTRLLRTSKLGELVDCGNGALANLPCNAPVVGRGKDKSTPDDLFWSDFTWTKEDGLQRPN